jgi:hypothetical protein
MSRAQTVFAVALAIVALLILLVGGYVVSSIRWGDRWYRRRP